MLRLGMIIYALTGPTLAGSAIVAMLVVGQDTLLPIVAAAVGGFAAAVPATWLITRKIAGRKG